MPDVGRSLRTMDAVILRGPLGVGKTTLARRLATETDASLYSIDQLLEEDGLEVWDEDRIALRSFLRANAAVVDRLGRDRAGRRRVVVEGNFYWSEALDDLILRLQRPALVLRLAAPVEVCVRRDDGRPAPDPARGPRAGDRLGESAVRDVFRLVAAVPRGVEVDARGPPEETWARLHEVLSAWVAAGRPVEGWNSPGGGRGGRKGDARAGIR